MAFWSVVKCVGCLCVVVIAWVVSAIIVGFHIHSTAQHSTAFFFLNVTKPDLQPVF